MECSLLSKYLPAIEKLPKGEPLTKDQLMTEEFHILCSAQRIYQ